VGITSARGAGCGDRLRGALPLCAIFTFDGDDRLAGEKVYYDRATVLHQLGVFHEPDGVPGRLNAALIHPIHVALIGR